MTFRPKSFDEALGSFKPLKRGRIASVSPRSDPGTADSPRKGFPSRAEPAQRKRRSLQSRPKRAKTTVDGDTARDIKLELDELVRQIIRLRDISCITCCLTAADRVLEVGHYYRRGIEPLRWNLVNCNRQCQQCNRLHEEEPIHYEVAMDGRYGRPALDVLEVASHSSHKFTYIELLGIRDDLRKDLAELGVI